MKKIIALLLAMSMLFALTACGGNDESTPTGESTGETTSTTESTTNTTDGTEDSTQGTTESTTGGDTSETTEPPTTTPPTTTPPTTTPPTTTPPTTTPPTTTPPATDAPHTHSYSSKVTTAATCGKEGVKTFTCSCGHSYTEKIAATGQHSWKSATCTTPKTCKTCGKTEGSKSGHNYVQGVCSVCGISVNDKTGPKITILSITPNPAKLGEKVTVRAKITDESGVESADVQLCNSVGNVAGGILNCVEGTAKDGVYEGTFTLPSNTPAGEWEANIYTRDLLGNTGLSWGDPKENFTVTGGVNDTTGPKITILSITPNPAKLGEKVTVRAKITDESGVRSADVQLCNSVGNVAGGILNLVEGNSKDGVYEGTFTLPSNTPAGEWEANIYTNDIYGNTGLSWGDPKENFTVTGGVNDTTGPKITILSITPNPAKLGGKVTVRAKITDESGVRSADVQLCNSVGNVAGGILNLVEGNSKDGIYEGTFTLPTSTPVGEWEANIYTNDIYGNTGLSWGDPKENFTVTAS